jgi:hypothetical protein
MDISKPIPPEMIAAIAMGMEEPLDIAFRYGFAASEYRALEQHRPFVAEVMSKRAEFERGGQTVKVKAAWMTENLLDDLYLRAKSTGASIQQIQETVKIMSKLGDLEPKAVQQVAQGTGFTVQIIIPAVAGADGGKTIEAQTQTLTFPTFSTPEVEDVEEIPPEKPAE